MHRKCNDVMNGPPGSGKSTQARPWARRQGVTYVGCGQMCRWVTGKDKPQNNKEAALIEELRRPLFKEDIQGMIALMDQGKLVDDAIVENLVERRLAMPDCREGYVLDGFPRTEAQALRLDTFFLENGCDPQQIRFITLELDEIECLRRIEARPDRSDDAEAKERMKIYFENIEKIQRVYGDRCYAVPGRGTIPEVWEQLTLIDQPVVSAPSTLVMACATA